MLRRLERKNLLENETMSEAHNKEIPINLFEFLLKLIAKIRQETGETYRKELEQAYTELKKYD